MSLTILDFAGGDAAVRPGIDLIQLNDALWRITRPGGEVLGYIERFEDRGTDRFRAKRLLPRQRRFLSVGEFWTVADALDCLRA